MNAEKKGIAAVGRTMYQELQSSHWGRMVVIDIDTGDYEIDDDLTATLRLRKRNPGATTWGERVGYPAPYRMSSRITSAPHYQRPRAVDSDV